MSLSRRKLIGSSLKGVAIALAGSSLLGPGILRAQDQPIRIVQNPWSASRANAQVARLLLEEELGISAEVTSLSETAQWDALARGDAHVSQEVWPSGHQENIQEFIAQRGVVQDLGWLGIDGVIGWWADTNYIDNYPSAASWQGYQDEEVAGQLSVPETQPRGRFLGADPSFTQYDEHIIDNLDLYLEKVFAGSESAMLAEVEARIDRGQPVLFYFWTPHAQHARLDLTQVELPQHDDLCEYKYSKAEQEPEDVDCGYPVDKLTKIATAGLQDMSPQAYEFFNNFQYTDNDDQISMIGAMEFDDLSVEEAARQWIADNEDVWQNWLP